MVLACGLGVAAEGRVGSLETLFVIVYRRIMDIILYFNEGRLNP